MSTTPSPPAAGPLTGAPALARSRDGRALVRRVAVLAAPAGPAAIAVIRYIYPPDAATALAEPGRMTAVLWLGLVALFTLVPGAWLAVRLVRLRAPVLGTVTGAFLVPGYLAMMSLGFVDTVYAVAPALGLDAADVERTIAAADALPAAWVPLVVFVVGHVVGSVLLGVAAGRAHLMPLPVAIAFVLSQPGHVVAVVIGSPLLDLASWGLTALGMGFLAGAVLRMPLDRWDPPSALGGTAGRDALRARPLG